jgi:hypothetical protein
MRVIKRSGESEEFDPRKTVSAMVRSGASHEEVKGIMEALEPQLYDGITTEEIYSIVRRMLQGRKAARYSLKKGILRLGPEGENFETYVSRLFQVEGFETRTRQFLNGRCIKHEVDVLMTRGEEKVMVECKFHNYLGIKCTIQIALYVSARFLDVKEGNKIDRPILATNPRFSQDALQYGKCVGLELLGWNSPEGNGIEELAERHRLFPVTILNMRKGDQDVLLDNHFIVVNDILDRADAVRHLLSKDSAENILAQAKEVLVG